MGKELIEMIPKHVLSNVVSLDISGNHVGKEGFALLAKRVSKLSVLSFSCDGVGKEELKEILKCPNLTTLGLSTRWVDNVALEINKKGFYPVLSKLDDLGFNWKRSRCYEVKSYDIDGSHRISGNVLYKYVNYMKKNTLLDLNHPSL